MNDSKIPVRYARALFESAVSQNLLDRVLDDMMYLAEICRTEDVRELLRSPIIPPSKKKNIIHKLFEKELHPLTLSLVDLMIKNGREAYLPAITRIFRDETLKYHGITEPDLVTALPVNDKIKDEITSFIAGKFNTKVRLKESVDPEIIGGFVLKINDYLVDASIRTRLRKIRKGLTGELGE